MADKRKAQGKSKTPAKKRKVETPKSAKKATPKKKVTPAKKSTPAKKKTPTPKKVTSTKVKKSVAKRTPAKSKTPTKSPVKKTKTPAKKTKTPAKPTASTHKKKPAAKTPSKPVKKTAPAKKSVKTPKKDEKKQKLAQKAITRAKLDKAKVAAMKAKLEKAKAVKGKAVAAKAKLKATKSVAAKKALAKAKVPVKKSVIQAKVKEAKKPELKKTPKPKASETKKEKKPVQSATKRKTESESDSSEAPRKRRMITPNKKFADFEMDIPAKRMITPNKKYADDYETDTSAKSVSELRAYIQDKKKTPKAAQDTSAKNDTQSASEKNEEEKETPAREIKVFKPSDMKPAEKLMKKLQKQLEKEAKAAATPKTTESREKAKIKITKVVTYNKPMSSDEKEMRSIERKATPKAKASVVKAKVQGLAAKTPTTPATKPGAIVKATPKAAVKPTPKQGKVPEKTTPKPKKIKELPKEERPIQAKFAYQKNIKLPDDNEKGSCWITGISVFPSGEIITVDMANRKIKLFASDFTILDQVKLDTIPQDISVSPVNASDAYFTKPFSKEGIQKISMSDGKLTLKESFWTNGTNRGITCTKSGILTSVQDGRYHDLDINHFKIDLLDYEGKVLQSVSTDSSGARLFKLPLYFTVDSTGKQVIVADCIKHLSYVVSVDMTGKIKFKYEGMNHNLITPRGLTIDDEDNIFVTEWERHNVYILSPTGKRIQILLAHQELVEEGIDGLLKPYQLCYYKEGETKKLIVSQEGCNSIKVFTLSKRTPETEANKQAEATTVTEKQNLPNGETSPEKAAPAASPKKTVSSTKSVAGVKATATLTEMKKAEPVKKVAEKTPTVVTIAKKQVTVVKQPVKQQTTLGTHKVQTVTPLTQAVVQPVQKETVLLTVATSNLEAPESTQTTEIKTAEVTEPTIIQEDSISGPPELEAEFSDELGALGSKEDDNSAVQDAIDSLNDSGENQATDESEAQPMEPVDTTQVQVQVYEQVGEPQTETLEMHSSELLESMQPEVIQVPVENVQMVTTSFEQQIGVPNVEEIVTQPMEGEIQAVPIETMGGEAVLIQENFEHVTSDPYQKIENVNNNDATNYIHTETVQYVTDEAMGHQYADVAQGEIITEMSEEVVSMEAV